MHDIISQNTQISIKMYKLKENTEKKENKIQIKKKRMSRILVAFCFARLLVCCLHMVYFSFVGVHLLSWLFVAAFLKFGKF